MSEPSTAAVVLSRRVAASSLTTLFALSASRMLRGRKLLILLILFALPTLFTLLVQRAARRYEPARAEQLFLFGMIPQALVPIAALVYASGVVQDELEEQTMTYLLLRPIPRWAIYATKLAATVCVTALLCSLGTTVCLAAAHRFDFGQISPARAGKIAAAISLAILTYCSLFGLLSLIVRRALVLGITYIILFEGVMANIDFVVRKLTIMYHFRVISIRWLDQVSEVWNIDLATAPSASDCVFNLVVASAILTFAAALLFDRKEFRVKTPD